MYTLLRTRHVFQAKRGKGEELKLFIGNLSEKVTPRQIRDLFEQHGPVIVSFNGRWVWLRRYDVSPACNRRNPEAER